MKLEQGQALSKSICPKCGKDSTYQAMLEWTDQTPDCNTVVDEDENVIGMSDHCFDCGIYFTTLIAKGKI